MMSFMSRTKHSVVGEINKSRLLAQCNLGRLILQSEESGDFNYKDANKEVGKSDD